MMRDAMPAETDATITIDLRASDVVAAIRERLARMGWDASRADIRFVQVGERHMDGIDVRAMAVGVKPDPSGAKTGNSML